MRVVRFAGPDGPRLGVVDGDVVVDLSAVDPAAPRDLREVLRAGRLPELERLVRGATSLVAHGEPVTRPASSEALDYEAELAVIIGRRARHLREEDCAAAAPT